MNSLKEVYQGVVQRDHEKVAAARAAQGLPPQVDLSNVDPELLKQAQDYDYVGRVLAHNVMADLVKEALDEAGVPDDKKGEVLADAMATARGEKKDDKKDDKKDGEGDKKDDDKKDDDEKVAAARRAILEKMAKDPQYFAQLAAKHQQKGKKPPAAKPRMR